MELEIQTTAGLNTGCIRGGMPLCGSPIRYEARATIQIRSFKQPFIHDFSLPAQYDEFVKTQIALMRSPAVIDKALENPAVAKLPIILKQQDKRAWLQKKLRIKTEGKSEIQTVRITTNNEDASEKIVNAVVDAYFAFIEEVNPQNAEEQAPFRTIQLCRAIPSESSRKKTIAAGLGFVLIFFATMFASNARAGGINPPTSQTD
jgi:capsular polysaccharide biosynthesis protein